MSDVHKYAKLGILSSVRLPSCGVIYLDVVKNIQLNLERYQIKGKDIHHVDLKHQSRDSVSFLVRLGCSNIRSSIPSL